MENINEDLIAQIVKKVLMEQAAASTNCVRHEDESGVISIKTEQIKPEAFDTGKAGDKVLLQDVFSLEESPRLGCGIMEMDKTTFDWNLTYDEVDYIIEGSLEIIIDGRKVIGNKGDIILIPKNTKIQFSVPEFARFMYVVYPANWAD